MGGATLGRVVLECIRMQAEQARTSDSLAFVLDTVLAPEGIFHGERPRQRCSMDDPRLENQRATPSLE